MAAKNALKDYADAIKARQEHRHELVDAAEHLVSNKVLLNRVNAIIGEPEPSSESSRQGMNRSASYLAALNDSSSFDAGAHMDSSVLASQSLAPLTTGGRGGHLPRFQMDFERLTSADLDNINEFPDEVIDQLYHQVENPHLKLEGAIDEEQQANKK